MVEYKIRRKVGRVGTREKGSLIIVLPKLWTRAHGVVEGEEVIVAFDGYNYLKVILRERSDPKQEEVMANEANPSGGKNNGALGS